MPALKLTYILIRIMLFQEELEENLPMFEEDENLAGLFSNEPDYEVLLRVPYSPDLHHVLSSKTCVTFGSSINCFHIRGMEDFFEESDEDILKKFERELRDFLGRQELLVGSENITADFDSEGWNEQQLGFNLIWGEGVLDVQASLDRT